MEIGTIHNLQGDNYIIVEAFAANMTSPREYMIRVDFYDKSESHFYQ